MSTRQRRRQERNHSMGACCSASAAAASIVCLLCLVVLLSFHQHHHHTSTQFQKTTTTTDQSFVQPTLRRLRRSLYPLREETNDDTSRNNNSEQAFLPIKEEFPSLQDSMEMARLSGLVYRFKHYQDCNATSVDTGQRLLPSDLLCHYYHHQQHHDDDDDEKSSTQVMIVSSIRYQYIAIVYAGTDNLQTTLADTDILLKPFGPLNSSTGESILLPDDDNDNDNYDVRVHAGFDNAVFQQDLYGRLVEQTTKLLQQRPNYRLFTTGHSLGGANAILTAVAMSLQSATITAASAQEQSSQKLPAIVLPADNTIRSITFGAPKVGNHAWRNAVHRYIDSATAADATTKTMTRPPTPPQLSIWRFCHGWDVVPRLPELYPFVHVGHTVQMNRHYYGRSNTSGSSSDDDDGDGTNGMRAYYRHYGNASLHYASVPMSWSAKPFIFLPAALWSHSMRHYQAYFTNYSLVKPEEYYVHDFETIDEGNHSNDNDEFDDAWIHPLDDDIVHTFEQEQEQIRKEGGLVAVIDVE